MALVNEQRRRRSDLSCEIFSVAVVVVRARSSCAKSEPKEQRRRLAQLSPESQRGSWLSLIEWHCCCVHLFSLDFSLFVRTRPRAQLLPLGRLWAGRKLKLGALSTPTSRASRPPGPPEPGAISWAQRPETIYQEALAGSVSAPEVDPLLGGGGGLQAGEILRPSPRRDGGRLGVEQKAFL